jgi:dienelactone hydrolase
MDNRIEQTVQVRSDEIILEGTLTLPDHPRGVVLFAHGSGSSRHSPRNRFVAHQMVEDGLATLLIDLLTTDEEYLDNRTRLLRFDIALLARRLVGATDWLLHHPSLHHLGIGLFGASTGAGAALVAAAERPDSVKAVVSRGGRPDLAGAALSRVQAPTLLIVGGRDAPVIGMNEEAMTQLHGEKRLEIIPGATHLFEEEGALETVAQLAVQWFVHYLPQRVAHHEA